MKYLTISDSKEYFISDGKPIFYLADTVWSAFTNSTIDEWTEYLDYRRTQGFNVLQINLLPQWDRSRKFSHDVSLPAFHKDDKGNIDFYNLNDEYFDKAVTMTKMAVDRGFIPALVLLWGDYVDFEWARTLEPNRIFPLEAIEPYINYVNKRFSEFCPIYLVSGDNNFKYETTHIYYQKALKIIKEISPKSLTTLHMSGGTSDLPENFIKSSYLDFYMYQSGHSNVETTMTELAHDFRHKVVKRPIINGEISYEGIRFSKPYQGRISAWHVRRIIWHSLLSGAKAGITYGAHGIWSWHNRNDYFTSKKVFDEPFPWRSALVLAGAWDAAYAKEIFEQYDLFTIQPSEILVNCDEEINASMSADGNKIIIYSSYNTEIVVKTDLRRYQTKMILLDKKIAIKPRIDASNEKSSIKMHDYNSDVLVVAIKN